MLEALEYPKQLGIEKGFGLFQEISNTYWTDPQKKHPEYPKKNRNLLNRVHWYNLIDGFMAGVFFWQITFPQIELAREETKFGKSRWWRVKGFGNGIWMKWQPKKVIAFIPFKSWPKNFSVNPCIFFLRVDWKSQPIFVNLDLDICIKPLKVEWQKWKIMVFPDDPFSLGPGINVQGRTVKFRWGIWPIHLSARFRFMFPIFKITGGWKFIMFSLF